ncbi:MAG: hypothetical protein AAGC57_03090 [Pseudomonadota bacterium]
MQIHQLDPFISGETLVLLEMLLVFGGLIWFARSQIRACRRDPSAEPKPSSLASDASERRDRSD